MIVTKQFATLSDANLWCTGALFGGADLSQPINGLVGQTLTLSAPAGSVTFTAVAADPTLPYGQLRFADIKLQIETAIATVKVFMNAKKCLVLQLAALTGPVALAAVSEGGRIPLGLPNNEAASGVFLTAPGGTAPAFVGLVNNGDSILITYNK